MSATVITEAITVTASESVVVVTSTIAASDLSSITGYPTSSATASSSSPTSEGAFSSSSSSANGASSSNTHSSSPASRTASAPIGAFVGGAVGGVVLLALLVLLACLYKRRSNAKKKAANPFPDDTNEKGPAVIAGLPPNPSSAHARPASGVYSDSLFMTDANSSMPLLGTERSFHGGVQPAGTVSSDAPSAHVHRPSTASLAPSFIMGSSASFAQSHGSHYGQPMNGTHLQGQDNSAAFAGAYPDVHRSAYYEPHVPPGIDPRSVAVGSAAAAYHNGVAASTNPGSPDPPLDPRAHLSGLPMGAAPSEYAAASEAARMRGVPQSGHASEPAWSGTTSPQGANSSRRGSHASALAMPPAASAHSHDEAESLHSRRPPAAGLPGFQSDLNTIPGSVAASEMASGDHHSLHSSAYNSFGDRSVPPRLPSIPTSSPLMMQGAGSFAPHTSFAAGGALPAAFSAVSPRLTTEPGTGMLPSSDPSNGGTFNSDGTYNTYTGAVKGQLRVVGLTEPHGQGQPTIAEESDHVDPARNMGGDSPAGEFWIDAEEKLNLGLAGRRLGQHSPAGSTSSINRTGSRMIEMLDLDEQPNVPDSVTGAGEQHKQTTSPPIRPPFWKERSRSAQSISKVFRSSPLLSANNASPSTDRSPAMMASHARLHGNASAGDSARHRGAEHEHPPSLDLGRSVASSAQPRSESPKTDGDADMWREASSKPKATTTSTLRKWTMKRGSQPASKSAHADNEVDVDQLFR